MPSFQDLRTRCCLQLKWKSEVEFRNMTPSAFACYVQLRSLNCVGLRRQDSRTIDGNESDRGHWYVTFVVTLCTVPLMSVEKMSWSLDCHLGITLNSAPFSVATSDISACMQNHSIFDEQRST